MRRRRFQWRQLAFGVLGIVPALLVEGGEAVKLHTEARGLEQVLAGVNIRCHCIVEGICHLAGEEPLPDELVELVLIGGKAVLDLVRAHFDHGGTDGLMSILGIGFGLIHPLGRRQVLGAELFADVLGSVCLGLVRDTQRVGTHVGNETHGAHARYLHAFVELLGCLHGAAGLEAQLAGGLLLEGRGGEGRCRALSADALLHRSNGEGFPFQLCQDAVSLLLVGKLHLALGGAVELGGKGTAAARSQQLGVDGPVLLRNELADLLFPSQIRRTVTDCTRPQRDPGRTFFHRNGDSL